MTKNMQRLLIYHKTGVIFFNTPSNEKLSGKSGTGWSEQVGAHHSHDDDDDDVLYSLPGEAASPSSRLSSSVV